MINRVPCGWVLYAVQIGSSSTLLLFGLHRGFFSLLRSLSVPDMGISLLTGLANLSWYELAFVAGGALQSPTLFTLLPFLGSATGLLSVILLFTNTRWRSWGLMLHLIFTLAVTFLCFLILLSRFWRGFPDAWRLVAVTASMGIFLWWFIYFLRTFVRYSAKHE